MTKYINNVFARMDLQDIRSFMLYEHPCSEKNTIPYGEQLLQSHNPIYERLEKLYTEQSERDKTLNELSIALDAQSEIYMEIGMKAGARLVFQLLFSNDPVEIPHII